MLDIKLIRENPEIVKANLAKRGNPECPPNARRIDCTGQRMEMNLTKLNDLRHDRKLVTIEIAKLKKAKQDAANELKKAKDIDQKSPPMKKKSLNRKRKHTITSSNYLTSLMTLFHLEKTQTTMYIKTWGTIPQFTFPIKNHIDLALTLRPNRHGTRRQSSRRKILLP